LLDHGPFPISATSDSSIKPHRSGERQDGRAFGDERVEFVLQKVSDHAPVEALADQASGGHGEALAECVVGREQFERLDHTP
jgi:hypothetical protein